MKTELNVVWNGGAKGEGKLKANYLDTLIAIPTGMGGGGNGANPKELLVSSATSCYMLTLVYMLEMKKLPVEEHTIDSEAVGGKEGIKIIHSPKVVLSSHATEEQVAQVKEAMKQADEKCEIGQLLKSGGVQIETNGEVVVKS